MVTVVAASARIAMLLGQVASGASATVSLVSNLTASRAARVCQPGSPRQCHAWTAPRCRRLAELDHYNCISGILRVDRLARRRELTYRGGWGAVEGPRGHALAELPDELTRGPRVVRRTAGSSQVPPAQRAAAPHGHGGGPVPKVAPAWQAFVAINSSLKW